MEIEQYRYGNLVMFRGRVCRINNIHGASGLLHVVPLSGDPVSTRAYQEFEGLPITDIGLLRLGFRSIRNFAQDEIYFIGNFGVYADGGDEWRVDIRHNKDSVTAFINIIRGIKYVHQLQNLYYAWMQKELVYGDFAAEEEEKK